jgi:hypothetical protein
MLLTLNPSETTPLCKIKAVNPPFRSVSTPRGTKDLRRSRSANPARGLGASSGLSSALEWSAESLAKRLRTELAPRAWKRLVQAAERRDATVEQLRRWGLSEVA